MMMMAATPNCSHGGEYSTSSHAVSFDDRVHGGRGGVRSWWHDEEEMAATANVDARLPVDDYDLHPHEYGHAGPQLAALKHPHHEHHYRRYSSATSSHYHGDDYASKQDTQRPAAAPLVVATTSCEQSALLTNDRAKFHSWSHHPPTASCASCRAAPLAPHSGTPTSWQACSASGHDDSATMTSSAKADYGCDDAENLFADARTYTAAAAVASTGAHGAIGSSCRHMTTATTASSRYDECCCHRGEHPLAEEDVAADLDSKVKASCNTDGSGASAIMKPGSQRSRSGSMRTRLRSFLRRTKTMAVASRPLEGAAAGVAAAAADEAAEGAAAAAAVAGAEDADYPAGDDHGQAVAADNDDGLAAGWPLGAAAVSAGIVVPRSTSEFLGTPLSRQPSTIGINMAKESLGRDRASSVSSSHHGSRRWRLRRSFGSSSTSQSSGSTSMTSASQSSAQLHHLWSKVLTTHNFNSAATSSAVNSPISSASAHDASGSAVFPAANSPKWPAGALAGSRSSGLGKAGSKTFHGHVTANREAAAPSQESTWQPVVGLEDVSLDMDKLLLGEKFAAGASSSLFRGVYEGRDVAVKVLALTSSAREEAEHERCGRQFTAKQFWREASTLATMPRHDNVVELIGVSQRLPSLCIVTEFVPGGSLGGYLRKLRLSEQKLPFEAAVSMATDIASGMAHIHHMGMIHRDLKPDNLLLTSTLRVKISDFGLAREDQGTGMEMTHEMGTYRWMAPEMLELKPYDKRVDVYSFSLILWELITTEVPFNSLAPVQAAFGVCSKNLRPKIPEDCNNCIATLLQQCWSKDPLKRPSFLEILLHLRSVQDSSASR